jgi:cytochrome P450
MTQAPAGPPLYMRREGGFDPGRELREIRETDGVRKIRGAFDRDVYLVTRHEDVKEALADPSRFSNVRPPQFLPFLGDMTPAEIKRSQAGNLLGMDPPDHHRVRRMLTPEFTLRRMKRLEPRIVEIVDEHLDALERAGAPADLVAEFALPIPSLVICELLGVPYADRQGFQERTARQLDFSVPMAERADLQRESRDYMDTLVTTTRKAPGEDMLGMLVREHGDDLTQDELVGIANLLLIAGHETTSNMLGLGTLALLLRPDQLAIVRDDPEAIGPAVEELMRWLSVVQSALPRFTPADTELGGVSIPAESVVILSMPSANRDPSATDDPDTLDVRRGVPGHLAFGHGVHHCLGAPLARMEMRIAFPALLRRFPGLALAGDLADVPYREYSFIYGLQSLEVTW